MDSRSMDVGGIRMRWEEAGAGPPIVFLHGIPTGPRLWRHVIPGVRGARALVWEMVGYGESIPAGQGRDVSVKQQAEYLAAWMRALGVEGAVLVGHDLGGGVAQIAAVRSPGLVSGLVLINAICYDSWPIPSIKAMRAAGALVERLPLPIFRLVFSSFLYRGHDNLVLAREAVAEHWPPYTRLGGAVAFVRQVRALNVHDTLAIADQLSGLGVPARLVWGAADQFQRIGYGYRLAHDLGARLDRIEGGRHFVPEDHPDRVVAAVNELASQVTAHT